MALWDREKKEKAFKTSKVPPQPEPTQLEPASSPEAQTLEPDTYAIILLNKLIDLDAVSRAAESKFGPKILGPHENNRQGVAARQFLLEGMTFFCSYMPNPHPPEVCNIAAAEDPLCSPEEKERLADHKAFLILVQKGGGVSMAEKARICRVFVRLAAAIIEMDEAEGAYLPSAGLLVSKRVYLLHAEKLEENLNDPHYFPAPLWISLHQKPKDDLILTGSWGLKQFGLLELWFVNAHAEWAELFQRLYLLSIFEITGKDFYKDGDTIQFTPGKTSVFRKLNGALFIWEET